MSKAHPSMQDVADEAGVHRATVSRALANDPRIPERTRTIVRGAAEKLGYRTNALVAALMSHRRAVTSPQFRAVIACVTSFSRLGAWRRHGRAYERIYAGAEERAEQSGYKIEEFCLNDPRLSPSAFSRMLRARGIHAMLIAPLPRGSGHLQLEWRHFAAVAIGYSLTRPELHRITTDHFGSLVAAMRRCRKLGYRRMGMLLPGGVNERTDRRWLGAKLAEDEHARPQDRVPALIVREFDETAFRKWFQRHRPEVVIGVQMHQALACFRRMKVQVPRDVCIVTLERREQDPEISGMFQNFERIGAAAVNTIIGMLHRGERGLPAVPEKTLIDATWVDGGTLPPSATGRNQRRTLPN
jgi:LacI family transcriptional regulator